MKIKLKKEMEYDAKFVQLYAGVRYWADAEINGVDDEDGKLMPFIQDDIWMPKIDIDKGLIVDWPIGTIADIHYKVCDECSYSITDQDGNIIFTGDDYVPNFLCPEGNGYGDYIIMKIDGDGKIAKWDFKLDENE